MEKLSPLNPPKGGNNNAQADGSPNGRIRPQADIAFSKFTP